MSYAWKNSYRVAYLSNVAPEIFARRLEHLAERGNQEVTPQDVVADARPEGAETHPLFEWDDSVAAEGFRVHQARNAINSLRIVQVVNEQSEEQIAYIHVQSAETDRHVYVPAAAVAQSQDYQQQAIEEALRYLRGFKKRYGHLKELSSAFEMVEAAITKMEDSQAAFIG